MKRTHGLSSINIFLFLIVALTAFGEALRAEDGITFQVSSPLAEDYSGQRLKYLSDLKHRAVIEWIQSNVAAGSVNVDELTNEFTEKYILDFKVNRGRVSGQDVLQMTGHLDGVGLQRWVRLLRAKNEGESLRALLILSSDYSDDRLYASQTRLSTQGKTLGQVSYRLFNQALSKYNSGIDTVDLRGLPMSTPPRKRGKIARLADFGPLKKYKTALWLHYSPCPRCGGSRLNLFFYDLGQSRLSIAQSHNLQLQPSDTYAATRVEKALENSLASFESKMDELIKGGGLFSSVFHMIVQGIQNYPAFLQLEKELESSRQVLKSTLREAAPGGAKFEIMSPVDVKAFSAQLPNEVFKGFKLEVLRIDSGTLVVRYLPMSS